MFQQIIRELVFIEEQKEKDDNAVDNDDDDDDGDDDDGERKYFLFKLQYLRYVLVIYLKLELLFKIEFYISISILLSR